MTAARPPQPRCPAQLAALGGTASYVALIVCLEMNRDARQARAAPAGQPSSVRKK
jgi:hypothetical protein